MTLEELVPLAVPKSGNISAVAYDASGQNFYVRFTNKTSYAYRGVPAAKWAVAVLLISAPPTEDNSVGSWFYREIRQGGYAGRRLDIGDDRRIKWPDPPAPDASAVLTEQLKASVAATASPAPAAPIDPNAIHLKGSI